MASAKDALRASLLSSAPSSGSREPLQPDGILTPTPDTPGESRSSNSSSLDCVPTTSTYLEDEDGERERKPALSLCVCCVLLLAAACCLLLHRSFPATCSPFQPPPLPPLHLTANLTPSSLSRDRAGRKPNELFGKFTWKIDRFSQINKRELRSAQFEVGDYKW